MTGVIAISSDFTSQNAILTTMIPPPYHQINHHPPLQTSLNLVNNFMVVSLGSGPWDQLFGGGNTPAFAVAAVAALSSGILAVWAIPRPGAKKPRSPV